MSVKKYTLAREFKEGVSARILNQSQDFKRCSEPFMTGWYWATQHIMGSLYDGVNTYLEAIGEEKIEMVEVMREDVPTKEDLQSFIKNYIPKGWKESIGTVDFVPMIFDEEFKIILNGGIPLDIKYNKWYINSAIQEWRKKYEV